MPEPPVIVERRDSIAILTLNRPGARNALGPELVAGLTDALGEAAADPSVRAVVLTGAGEAFCGGADLKSLRALQGASLAENDEDVRRLKDLFILLGTFPKPVVAAVNGPALAGGCGLVSLCDVVLASPQASFGYPEVRVGFVAAMVLVFLARQIGERRARALLLSGKSLGAPAAVALGLADRIVPQEQLASAATGCAAEMAANAPEALAMTKDLLWRTSGQPLGAALELAAQVNVFARTGPEMREGLEAFAGKRPPRWRQP